MFKFVSKLSPRKSLQFHILVAVALLIAASSVQADPKKAAEAFIKRDYIVAFIENLKCAIKGDANAQSNLAVMYLDGLAVEKDPQRAYMWYTIASDFGYRWPPKERKFLENKLTPKMIKDAEAEANSWIRKYKELKKNSSN